MKPNWKDAPEWANWLAMEGDGGWYWFEDEPKIGHDYTWIPVGGKSRIQYSGHETPWSDNIEQRPRHGTD